MFPSNFPAHRFPMPEQTEQPAAQASTSRTGGTQASNQIPDRLRFGFMMTLRAGDTSTLRDNPHDPAEPVRARFTVPPLVLNPPAHEGSHCRPRPSIPPGWISCCGAWKQPGSRYCSVKSNMKQGPSGGASAPSSAPAPSQCQHDGHHSAPRPPQSLVQAGY